MEEGARCSLEAVGKPAVLKQKMRDLPENSTVAERGGRLVFFGGHRPDVCASTEFCIRFCLTLLRFQSTLFRSCYSVR